MGSVTVIALMAGIIPAYVASMVWIERDAEARGVKDDVVGALALIWPFSLLIWIVFRPARPTRESTHS
jgi:hypothetical protein